MSGSKETHAFFDEGTDRITESLDFKDLQDDKELVFKTSEILNNCISILNEVLNNLSPNKKKML